MNQKLGIDKGLAYRSLAASLGSLLLSSVGTAGAFAEENAPAVLTPLPSTSQAAPSLPALLNSIPPRPTAAPAPTAEPGEPAIAPETADQTVRLRLSLSDRRVYVYRGEAVEVSYPVAIGRSGWETPPGEFSVFSQIVDPGWTNPFTNEISPPGPENPLGDRWIGFWSDGNNVIGFHGTPNRDSVGKAASHGCVRMYNEDVRALYDVVAIGTPVIVEP